MIVLLGGSGYVGNAFRRCLQARSLEYVSVRRGKCNYYDRAALDELLRKVKPRFLINAAGFTGRPNVDACELHKAECLVANAVLPGIIREACERRQVPWGHLSSGCIYSGARHDGSGFRVDDPPNFCFRSNQCSFYSGSKALGEEVLAGAERCYIWRLRVPFNHMDHERNYLSKLMRYSKLVDVRNSLSHLDECAEACVASWTNEVPFGIYHLTNSGSVTTREVVAMIRRSGVCARNFKFYESEAEFLEQAVKTPRSNCILDNSKAVRAGLRLSQVFQAVERSLHNWTGRSC